MPAHPWRRRLSLISTCVALAFAVQIPLAWSCVALSGLTGFSGTNLQLIVPANAQSDAETIDVQAHSAIGVRSISLVASPPMGLPRRTLAILAGPNGTLVRSRQVAPWSPAEIHPVLVSDAAWPATTGASVTPNVVSYCVSLAHVEGAGWPFACVEGRIDYDPASRAFSTNGVLTSAPFLPASVMDDAGYYCYHPRWTGYLANTVVDGALLALLYCFIAFGARAVIGANRRRRGLRVR